MTLKSVDTLLDVLHFADSHTAVIVRELGISVTYDSLRQQVLAMADATNVFIEYAANEAEEALLDARVTEERAYAVVQMAFE